jgi:tRNA(fMet)-specific endonuclease VapC
MIDTSVFIDLERRRQEPAALAGAYPDDNLAMAAITVSELLVGVHRADSQQCRRRREVFVEGVIQVIEVISFDLRVARQHAITCTRLVRTGRMIKVTDLLIAATALAHGFTVLTRDVQDFSHIPGLAVQMFDESVS